MRKVCGNDTQNLWYAEQQFGCIAIQKWYAEHRCFFSFVCGTAAQTIPLIDTRSGLYFNLKTKFIRDFQEGVATLKPQEVRDF